ncbi:MAG TPA: outer membrane beta-barrel protein [Candidatus Saccharimonadales bacterium]|nr:outer membrane beta-barrel protein [Candidatus Saccharimonadales bacterium]
MRGSQICLVAGVILLCAASLSAAGIYEKGFELGLDLGRQSSNEPGVTADSCYGARVGWAITQKLMIEGDFAHFGSQREYAGFAGDPSSPANQVPFSKPASTEFDYYTIGLTASFRTATDARTLPYITVGMGSVVQTRAGARFCVDLKPGSSVTCADVNPDGTKKDPNASFDPGVEVSWQEFLPREDTGTLLTVGAGARTFFTDWIGVRYEVKYYHHDAFDENQDTFEGTFGATFFLGGRR